MTAGFESPSGWPWQMSTTKSLSKRGNERLPTPFRPFPRHIWYTLAVKISNESLRQHLPTPPRYSSKEYLEQWNFRHQGRPPLMCPRGGDFREGLYSHYKKKLVFPSPSPKEARGDHRQVEAPERAAGFRGCARRRGPTLGAGAAAAPRVVEAGARQRAQRTHSVRPEPRSGAGRALLAAGQPRARPPNALPSLWARVGAVRKRLPRPLLSHHRDPFPAAASALSGQHSPPHPPPPGLPGCATPSIGQPSSPAVPSLPGVAGGGGWWSGCGRVRRTWVWDPGLCKLEVL